MRIALDLNSADDYRLFLKIKALPTYRFVGREAVVPDEYASRLDMTAAPAESGAYRPIRGLFDYQRDITALAIRKRKFAIFADCGLGKTIMFMEFARHASAMLPADRSILIVSPLMVIDQTLAEACRWYQGNLPIERIATAELPRWAAEGGVSRIGVTNYEALTDAIPAGRLGALIIDESSMLKSHYGAWGQQVLRLGRGLDWKLALTGTPAPNDRIEYANHAVFLDAFPTVNSFLARYFVNRGQTNERWELKPHALRPFYRALSHWCVFLTNPATYGWKDNTENIPPIHIHIHDIDLTDEQRSLTLGRTGRLFADAAGGITSRGALARIAKGRDGKRRIETNKPDYIRALVDSWPDESTILWVYQNDEQDQMEATFPEAASLRGATPLSERRDLIAEFQAGGRKILISKPKILGFGLNLQVATRQVFNGLRDSYEEFYQAVKRSNRYGSTRPLNVHVPITEIERPMVETVLRKAARIQADTEEQEAIFKGVSHAFAR